MKVQENIDATTIWDNVRNLIVKIDSTSRISDGFKQGKMRASGATVGTKACRACGRKGHMAAACTVPKTQLKCKYCATQNSHNTAACIKKQKVEKEKKEGDNKNSKKDTNPKAKTTSLERRDASGNNKRDLSQPKDNRSPQRLGNSCAQVRCSNMGNKPSGNYSDSDEEDDYDTPPETLESDNDLEEENDDPNMPEISDDNISEDEDNKNPSKYDRE